MQGLSKSIAQLRDSLRSIEEAEGDDQICEIQNALSDVADALEEIRDAFAGLAL